MQRCQRSTWLHYFEIESQSVDAGLQLADEKSSSLPWCACAGLDVEMQCHKPETTKDDQEL